MDNAVQQPISDQDQLAGDIASAQPQNQIAALKQQYPAYKDIPDIELADALHQKYYSDVPRDSFMVMAGMADAGGNMATGMDRVAYQKRFLADNPQANQGAVDAVMAQYDQQAAARAKAAADAPAAAAAKTAAMKAMPTEQLLAQDFNERLNARLQGPQNGIVPQLPGELQPEHLQNVSYHAPSTFDEAAGGLTGGALNTLIGAGAAGLRLVGDDADAAEWDAGRQQVAARQKELGGDTFTGKVSSLVGGIVPALAVPEGMVEQYIGNAGLFAMPAFQDTLKAKLAEGYSRPLALAHAAEAFGINLFAPTVMQKGVGAVLGHAAEGATGLWDAAKGVGSSAAEGVGFSALNSGLDKVTDIAGTGYDKLTGTQTFAGGENNNRPWIDPEDMAVQATGFGMMRGAHLAVGVPGAIADQARQRQLLDQIGQAGNVDDAIAAASAAVSTPATTPGDAVASMLQSIRPLETPMTWQDANAPAATGTPTDLGRQYMRVTNPDGSTGFAATPEPGPELANPVNSPVPAGAGMPADPGVGAWRRANDPTIPTLTNSIDHLRTDIPTLTDHLVPPDGTPAMNDEVPGQAPPPTLTDEFARPASDSWYTFPRETGTLGIPRAEMPQIKAEHRGALVNFLNARGISHEHIEVPADSLKPTQAEFSMEKLQKAKDYQGGDRSILTSIDGHVLDGHHQWLGNVEDDQPTKTIRLNAPIRQLLDTVREFPSASTSDGAPTEQRAAAGDPATTDGRSHPAPVANHLDAAREKHQRQDDAVAQALANINRRKASGGDRTRARLAGENPFLAFLANHGVSMQDRADLGLEAGNKGNRMVPGFGPVLRRTGKRLDELALLAHDEGFLTKNDLESDVDTGGTRKLADMIRQSLASREVITRPGDVEANMPDADQHLVDEAQRLGIETQGKHIDQLYDEVSGVHRAREDRRERIGAGSIDEQAEIEHHADQFTPQEIAAVGGLDTDIPLDGAAPSDHLTDEDIDAIFKTRPTDGARADRGQAQGDAAEHAQEGAEGAAGTREGSAGLEFRGIQYRKDRGIWKLSRDGEKWAEVRSRDARLALDRGEDPNPTDARVAKREDAPSVGERKDDPYTRDLFGGQDLFDDIPTRAGTIDAQKDAGRAAVSALARRLGIDRINRRDPAQGAKVSVLGSRLMADFVAGKPAQLVGQKVATGHDLAALAQVYRDPRFETFRVFYMRDTKIVGEAGYTSRLPAAVHMPDELYEKVREDKKRFGASGYYLLHNHPSGRAEPSPADESMTRAIDAQVGGFLGHIVIDHNEYAVIQNWGSEVHQAPHLNGQNFSAIPEIEHGLLGQRLNSPDAVARAAKALQVKDGFATLVMTNAKSETSLIVDVPIKALALAQGRDGRARAKALIRRMARETGAGSHRFLILPNDSLSMSPYLHLLADGIVTDIARPNGTTALQEGKFGGGNFMDNQRRKSIKVAEQDNDGGFYSALGRTALAMEKIAGKDGTVKPDQAQAWLAARQKEGKFKAEELQWSGVDDWLKAQHGRVPVADIVNFLQHNGVQVREVMKGEVPDLHSMTEAQLRAYADEKEGPQYLEGFDFNNQAERDAVIEDLGAAKVTNLRYGNYTLPGGENYRELLLTLPEPSRLQAAKENGFRAVKSDEPWFGPDEWSIEDSNGDGRGKGQGTTADEALANWAEHRKDLAGGITYKSSHWDEPNILAHIRFNDRTDADGKKVLFIEELQSDWGQQGKREGFIDNSGKPDISGWTATEDYMSQQGGVHGAVWRVRKADGTPANNGIFAETEAEAIAKAAERFVGGEGTVPTGPFVTDTKAWTALALKRMIRYAIEHDYDRVAFVNGEQSASRYDLSKQISRIEFDDNSSGGIGRPELDGPPGSGILRAFDKSGKQVMDEHVFEPKRIADLIGKEAAAKLLDSAPSAARSAGMGVRRRVLEGVDLSVGGDGMKTFYDRIVPQVAGDVLKKLGGGKLGSTALVTDSRLTRGFDYSGPTMTEDELADFMRTNNLTSSIESQLKEVRFDVMEGKSFKDAMEAQASPAAAEAIGGTLTEKDPEAKPQLSFDITPGLRASVAGGVPLFDITDRNGSERRGALRSSTDRRTIEVDGERRPIYDTSGRLIGGGDFAKQQEFWRNFDGETDASGRPILADDDTRAVYDIPGHDGSSDVPELMRGDPSAYDAPKRVATLAKLKAARRGLEDGRIDEQAYHARVDGLIDDLQARNAARDLPKDRDRGAGWVMERLMRARRSGDLDEKTVNFALWALDKNPHLANDLGISLRAQTEQGNSGSYRSADKVMSLFKGAENPGTAVHEILHHAERMMPEQVQAGIVDAWRKAFARAYDRADAPTRAALEDMLAMSHDRNAAQRVMKAFQDGVLSYGDHYQLSNPSEYWAVNATRIMADRHQAAGWVGKAHQWLAELGQKVKGWLGLPSDAPVLKALQAVLDGTGTHVSPRMLVERATSASGHIDPVLHDVPDLAEPDPKEAAARQSALARLLKTPKELLRSAAFNVRMLTVPMAAGSDTAMSMAKQFANNNRRATAQWKAFDKVLRENYTPEQLAKMWTAADQENDLRRDGRTSDSLGLSSLTAGERKTVELLHAYGQELWTKAQNAGMVEGDGVAFWTPRVAARIAEDGSAEGIRQAGSEFSKDARNLRTSASSLKHRKYDTTEESEAALQTKLGDGAAYVKDIRVMPLAMAQLERAIAGRTLVNQIKAHGKLANVELVAEGARPDFVTFDHPALKQWRPRMDWEPVDPAVLAERGYEVKGNAVYRGEDRLASYRVAGDHVEKMAPMLDSAGKPVLEAYPLFVRKEFAGPLKAVFSKEPHAVYRALMSIKGGVTSMIMISPLTHNLVIWGKAIPTMTATMGWKNNLKNAGTLGFRSYFVGNAARADHALMNELIEAGLVPVSGRGMTEDAAAIHNGLVPGRSMTARAVGAVFDMASPKAGDMARRGIDKAGEIWHERLLWDRVADLQAGMAVMMRTSLIDKGIDQYTANRLAVHFANRYAGMIPHEAMSDGAHMLLNLSLFSKSFTMTNLGAYKDVLAGLPKDARAQIQTRAFELHRAMGKSEDEANTAAAGAISQVQKIARKKALAILVLDVAAMTTVASITQALWQGQGGQQIADDFKERLARLGVHLKEDPLSVLGHPLDSLASLSQTSDNPHGKEDRVRVGEDEAGNSYYARLPVGKVGEEIKQYGNIVTGLHLAHNKMSTFLRPIADLTANEDITGKRIINPNDNLVVQAVKFGAYWAKLQMPTEELASAYHLARGDGDHMDKLKLLGMATGVSVSRLAGGDEVAEIRYQNREQQAKLRDVLPDVREALRRDDTEKAHQLLEEAGQTPREAQNIIKRMDAPDQVSRAQRKRFSQHSTDAEREKLERIRNRRQ